MNHQAGWLAVRIERAADAGPRENNPRQLAVAPGHGKLVGGVLRFIRRAPHRVRVQGDERRRPVRVADGGQQNCWPFRFLEHCIFAEEQVPRMPVLGAELAAVREQVQLGREVGKVVRGIGDPAGTVPPRRLNKKEAAKMGRSENLCRCGDGLRDSVAPQRPAAVGEADQRVALRQVGGGPMNEKEFVVAVPIEIGERGQAQVEKIHGGQAAGKGLLEQVAPDLAAVIIGHDEAALVQGETRRRAAAHPAPFEQRTRNRPSEYNQSRRHAACAPEADAAPPGRPVERRSPPAVQLLCPGDDPALLSAETVDGQPTLPLPLLGGSRSDAEIRGDLLPGLQLTSRRQPRGQCRGYHDTSPSG